MLQGWRLKDTAEGGLSIQFRGPISCSLDPVTEDDAKLVLVELHVASASSADMLAHDLLTRIGMCHTGITCQDTLQLNTACMCSLLRWRQRLVCMKLNTFCYVFVNVTRWQHVLKYPVMFTDCLRSEFLFLEFQGASGTAALPCSSTLCHSVACYGIGSSAVKGLQVMGPVVKDHC